MLCRANGPFQAAAFIIEGSTGHQAAAEVFVLSQEHLHKVNA